MQDFEAAFEISAASWEQWVGAAMRVQCAQALLASMRRGRRAKTASRQPARTRRSLFWMLAVSALGYWIL